MDNLFRITEIQHASDQVLKDGVFLVLLHADRVPPHLYLMVNQQLFTLNNKGPGIKIPYSVFHRSITRKRTKTLFVKLHLPEVESWSEILEQVTSITNSYERVISGGITCIEPIKDFCGLQFKHSFQTVNFIHELIPELEKLHAVEDIFQLNINSNEFLMRKYGFEEIYKHIEKINGQSILV